MIMHLRRAPVIAAWVKTLCLALAALVIGLHWVNTRVAIVRTNQFAPRPVLPTSYALYHSMATGLSEGRIGEVDLAAVNRHTALNDPWAPFERSSANVPPNWVSFY